MIKDRPQFIRSSLSLLLILFMIATSITPAYATSYDPNATQGKGTNTDTISDGTGFSIVHQGYRISILSGDKPFPGVAKPVQDLWYSTPPSNINKYMTYNRLGVNTDNNRGNIIGQGNLAELQIPHSIEFSGDGFSPNGIAVREYLLSGTGGGSGGTGSGGTSGPSINWGGSAAGQSIYKENYGLNDVEVKAATYVSRYYVEKLKTYYDQQVSSLYDAMGTPDEFRQELTKYTNQYCEEIDWKYTNGGYKDRNSREVDLIRDLIEKNNESLIENYTAKYNRIHVEGVYSSNSQSVPSTAGEESTGSGDPPLTDLIKILFTDGTDAGKEKLINDINADPEFRIMLETLVWYVPRTSTNVSLNIKIAGTAKNIADFNNASASIIGNSNGGYMAKLTNQGLPKGLMLEKDDTVLDILMPTDPGSNQYVSTPAIGSNYGWGIHIYTKGDGGTHTWDSDTYPDGDPGPAPLPPGPGSSGDPKDPDPDNPTDPDPSNPTGGGYNITIIKFYESNNTPESNFTRENNPGSIQVEDEPLYHLVDWYYSPDRVYPPSQNSPYEDTKSQCLITDTGTDPTTVNVVNPDTTLYLKLVKQDPTPQRQAVDFVLKESEITKAYNGQDVIAQPSWPRGNIFNWAGGDLSGDCGEKIIVTHSSGHYEGGEYIDDSYDTEEDCPGKYQLEDISLEFYVELSNTPDNRIYANVDPFKGKDFKGRTESRSSIGGSDPHSTDNEYEFVIWRGYDVPTISNYKMENTVEILKLTQHYGAKPTGTRYDTGRSYIKLVSIELSKSGQGDYLTTSKTNCQHTKTKSSNHDLTGVVTYNGNATVEVYHRLKSKTLEGKSSPTGVITTYNIKTPYSIDTKHTDGYRIQTSPLTFYPYIRMTYQKPQQYSTKTDAQVLSEGKSILVPNDYAEAGWVTPSEEESMTLKSQQWSTHQRAIANGKDWNGKNQVLPGGAIYQLDTQSNQAVVSISTWQTVILPKFRP